MTDTAPPDMEDPRALVRVTATGNAGFFIQAGGFTCAIDALWRPPPRFLGGPPLWRPPRPLDLIAVTHQHWDHFDPTLVRKASGPDTTIVGPSEVLGRLAGARARLVACGESGPDTPSVVAVGPARITGFSTSHGRAHVSFLIELGGVRMFHDGDNEDTRPLSVGLLQPLDVLILCPWQGSGWVEFVESVSPRYWCLSHLSEHELIEHHAGRFLPQLCDRVPVPDRIVALRPGESLPVR